MKLREICFSDNMWKMDQEGLRMIEHLGTLQDSEILKGFSLSSSTCSLNNLGSLLVPVWDLVSLFSNEDGHICARLYSKTLSFQNAFMYHGQDWR